MKWLVATAAVLIVVCPMYADIRPPIPKGFKEVPFKYRIVTAHEFPDYSFYTIELARVQAKTTRTAAHVKLDPKNPVTLSPGGGATVSTAYELFAIPKDAEKKYATEKELHKAIIDWTVPGQVKAKMTFASSGSTHIKDSDPRKEVVEEHKIEKIDPKLDAKEGIVLTSPKPAKEEPGKSGSEECDEPRRVDRVCPEGRRLGCGARGSVCGRVRRLVGCPPWPPRVGVMSFSAPGTAAMLVTVPGKYVTPWRVLRRVVAAQGRSARPCSPSSPRP